MAKKSKPSIEKIRKLREEICLKQSKDKVSTSNDISVTCEIISIVETAKDPKSTKKCIIKKLDLLLLSLGINNKIKKDTKDA